MRIHVILGYVSVFFLFFFFFDNLEDTLAVIDSNQRLKPVRLSDRERCPPPFTISPTGAIVSKHI